MANLVAQIKERLLSSYGLETMQNEKMALPTETSGSVSQTISTAVSSAISETADFTLECSIQALKGHSNPGLSSRVNYYFPSRVPASLNDVFRYVDALNPLLQHSEVFVVQDLDGDHSYYLRMDTVLTGHVNTNSVSMILDYVTQDVGILMKYFRYNMLSLPASESNNRSILRKCG